MWFSLSKTDSEMADAAHQSLCFTGVNFGKWIPNILAIGVNWDAVSLKLMIFLGFPLRSRVTATAF